MPQNQIVPQTGLINKKNNLIGDNISMLRRPQMKITQNPRYKIRANFRPEVTKITKKLAEGIREAVWDCQRSKIYTQEAFESNLQKYLKNIPEVTVISYGTIQKIDQYGNPWEEWMDGKPADIETLLQPPWMNPLSNPKSTVATFVPLESTETSDSDKNENSAEDEEAEKKSWWERAWDSVKDFASDVWDTVSSEEFIDKAVNIAGVVLGAVTVGILLVGTAGAAGALAGAVVSSLGASALAGAASTATTVGGYALAACIGVDAVNSSIAVGTGTNYIAKGAYSLFGSENQTEQDFVNGYGEARDILYMASLSYGTYGAYAVQSGFSSQKSIEGGSETKGYSDFADGMSQEDATRYIADNETKFYSEFLERASKAGLNNTQISEAYNAMKSGDYAKMASYFGTSSPYSGAVFWSGNKTGAGQYATSMGGTLMEQTSGGRVFDNWRGLQGMYNDWGTGTAFDQKPIWDSLSIQYANGANGVVTYVHPDGYYGNVWKHTELPILNERLEEGLVNSIQEVIIDGK